MAITRVQTWEATAANANAPITAASASNVAAGNMIIVLVETFNSAITVSVTDSLSNTYTQVDTYSANGNYRTSIWYAANISGGACTVTVTPSASAYRSIVCMEFSGAAASPLDGSSKNTGTSTSALSTGTITVSQAGDLVVAVFGPFSNYGSVRATEANTSVVFARISTTTPSNIIAQAIVGSSINPSVTIGAADTWSAIGASFKAASAGGSGGLLSPPSFNGGFG